MCDVRQVRVSGCVVKVVVAAAMLLALAAPGHSSPGDPWGAAERAPGDPPDDRAARIDRARQQVLDERYQAELPRYQGEKADTGAGSTQRPRRRAGGELGAGDADHPGMVDARKREAPGAMSSLMTMIMWGMVIVLVALGLFWLASELAKLGGDAELPSDDEPSPHQQDVAAILDRPLGDADELARRGQFAEAIHTLLLRTLQELVRDAAVRVAPATTSREILARVPLLADARSALAGLVTAVEVTHFGDEPANAADYERCRQQFHVFAAALRGGGRPQAVAA